MKQQLYDGLVCKYSVGVSNQKDFIPSDNIEQIVETLEGKLQEGDISLNDFASEDVNIEQKNDGSYDISIENVEIGQELGNKGTINYSPDNQRCVTHSNMVIDDTPPEGLTYDGNDEMLGGIR